MKDTVKITSLPLPPPRTRKKDIIKEKKDNLVIRDDKGPKQKPSAPQNLVDYGSETKKTDSPGNTNSESEDGTDAEYLCSNSEGYPDSEGISEKGNEETNSESNTNQRKADNVGDQAISSRSDKGVDTTDGNSAQKRKEVHAAILQPLSRRQKIKRGRTLVLMSTLPVLVRRIKWIGRITMTRPVPPSM